MPKSPVELLPRRRSLRLGRDTREEILNAAEELLQRRGYNAFSYHHIAVRLGIRNAAIHYHFPAKEDLGVALIRRYRERFDEWRQSMAGLADAWDKLQAYFKTYRDYLQDQCKCCPGGVLGTEFDAIPQVMRDEARQLMREIYEWLIATLEQGRAQGTLCFKGRAEDEAVVLGSTLQGALQIARLAGPERFHQALDQLALELTGRVPERQAAA
ncbi:MAG: TetR/AcrR family transcriptional regulator [Gammaproteobacteria bacterium]|nr:TetR/AcrR family transcriptional regulator [Gammaproteobacteria bacterium]